MRVSRNETADGLFRSLRRAGRMRHAGRNGCDRTLDHYYRLPENNNGTIGMIRRPVAAPVPSTRGVRVNPRPSVKAHVRAGAALTPLRRDRLAQVIT